jgi:FkbM family methyltransferase
MTKDMNSKIQTRLLIKNLLISPLKLLSCIASFYASLLETIKGGLGNYWLECEAEKNSLRKQTITHFQNSKILKLTLFTPNWICRFRANTFSTKEPETLEWLDKSESDGVFFDIGANVGLYSLYYAATKKGKVYAFEPSVFNLSLLAKNIYENRLHDQIKIITNPLTQQNQFADFAFSTIEEGGALSAFGVDHDHDGKPINKNLTYQTLGLSLDFLITNNIITERPSLIKIDVDGIEHLILAGAIETLKHPTCKSVLIETNDTFPEQANSISKILVECGFSLKEKRQSEMVSDGKHSHILNHIWYKS